MKIFLKRIIIGIALLLCCASQSQAADVGWTIESFSSDVESFADSHLEIEETIVVDFSNLKKHGIFRTIPVKYKDKLGNTINIRLRDINITNEVGQAYPFTTSRKGNDLELKIGDPNKTVQGVNTYVIHYSVQQVVTRFKDHDEIYWNVTGDNWPVPIMSAVAKIKSPGEIIDSACFTGPFGASFQDCTSFYETNSAEFNSYGSLFPGEGLTVVIALPKGVIAQIPLQTKILWFLCDNWPYAIPLLVFLIFLSLYWQHGRDDQYKSLFDPTLGVEKHPLFSVETIPSTYAPIKDISPAIAGTLIDEEINIRDIASTIIDLAVRGYVKIEELRKKSLFIEANYELTLVKEMDNKLTEFETALLTSLFGTKKTVRLNELKYKFHDKLAHLRDSLFNEMVDKKYFPARPDRVVVGFRILGGVVAGLGFFTIGFSLAWTFAAILSGIIIFFFAKAMPKRTAHGRKQYLRVVGLRNFVSLGAYREKLWEQANLFEEVMPYAIAFNLTHKWAEAFKQANVPEPSWYKGTGVFQPSVFSHSMESFTRTVTTTLPSVKSSASSGGSGFSGGGFSGGGFGGGGGGSW